MKTKLKNVQIEEFLKFIYGLEHQSLKYPMIDKYTLLENKAENQRSWGPFPYELLELTLENNSVIIVQVNEVLDSEEIYIYEKNSSEVMKINIFENKKPDEEVSLLEPIKEYLKQRNIEVENINELIQLKEEQSKEIEEDNLPF